MLWQDESNPSTKQLIVSPCRKTYRQSSSPIYSRASRISAPDPETTIQLFCAIKHEKRDDTCRRTFTNPSLQTKRSNSPQAPLLRTDSKSHDSFTTRPTSPIVLVLEISNRSFSRSIIINDQFELYRISASSAHWTACDRLTRAPSDLRLHGPHQT